MDSWTLGRAIGEIEHRLDALEKEWQTIKYYGRRGLLLLSLAATSALSHLNAQQVAYWLKNLPHLILTWLSG